jgi:3-hydroxybutyryl-CoA dehydrogenase
VIDLPRDVAVLGAGTMGRGIALVFGLAGCNVRVAARRESSLADARAGIADTLETLCAAGVVEREQAETLPARVRMTTVVEEAVADCGLVVESVGEDLEMKRALFARVEAAAPDDAILTTNTSSLSLDEIARDLRRPELFAGLHWFNPPELVELVEVVRSSTSADRTEERLVAWMEALGKKPVRVRKATPGFIANRLQYAVFREAFALVESGVCGYADLDDAVKYGLGPRWAAVGPFESLDLGGLDVHEEVARQLYPVLASSEGPPRTVTELVASGSLGCKSGRGLYGAYGPDDLRRLHTRRRSLLLGIRALRERLAGAPA